MPLVRPRRAGYVFILVAFTIVSCATAGFWSGEPKNSLPLLDQASLERVHSIAVIPFYGDRAHWRETAQQVLSDRPARLSVVPLQSVDSALGSLGKELLTAGPAQRAGLVGKAARLTGADAVVNGMILWKEKPEIIIQIVGSRDGRVLYWQAADFTMREAPTAAGQRELFEKLLGAVVRHAARMERRVPPPLPQTKAPEQPAPERQQEAGEPPTAEPQRQPERKTRPERRGQPQAAPFGEDISPM